MEQTTPPEMGDAGELKEMLNAVSTPQELRELLEADGVDDNVINQFVQDVGIDNVLDRIFTLMGTRFLPDKAGGDGGVVQWKIDTPAGTRAYHVVIADGKAEGGRGAPDSPKVTLGMTMPNLLRLCAGKLNGVTGVMTGKIKISGDMMFAAKMQGWFDY